MVGTRRRGSLSRGGAADPGWRGERGDLCAGRIRRRSAHRSVAVGSPGVLRADGRTARRHRMGHSKVDPRVRSSAALGCRSTRRGASCCRRRCGAGTGCRHGRCDLTWTCRARDPRRSLAQAAALGGGRHCSHHHRRGGRRPGCACSRALRRRGCLLCRFGTGDRDGGHGGSVDFHRRVCGGVGPDDSLGSLVARCGGQHHRHRGRRWLLAHCRRDSAKVAQDDMDMAGRGARRDRRCRERCYRERHRAAIGGADICWWLAPSRSRGQSCGNFRRRSENAHSSSARRRLGLGLGSVRVRVVGRPACRQHLAGERSHRSRIGRFDSERSRPIRGGLNRVGCRLRVRHGIRRVRHRRRRTGYSSRRARDRGRHHAPGNGGEHLGEAADAVVVARGRRSTAACGAFLYAANLPTAATESLVIATGIAALVLSLLLSRASPRSAWLIPAAGFATIADLSAVGLAVDLLPNRTPLSLTLLIIGAETAAAGITMRRVALVCAAPALMCAAWLLYASTALAGNPEWLTVPIGAAVLLTVELARWDSRRGHPLPVADALIALELLGMSLVVITALVQTITDSILYGLAAIGLALILLVWGVITRARRRVFAGAVALGGMRLFQHYGATTIEHNRARVRATVRRLDQLMSGWERT